MRAGSPIRLGGQQVERLVDVGHDRVVGPLLGLIRRLGSGALGEVGHDRIVGPLLGLIRRLGSGPARFVLVHVVPLPSSYRRASHSYETSVNAARARRCDGLATAGIVTSVAVAIRQMSNDEFE